MSNKNEKKLKLKWLKKSKNENKTIEDLNLHLDKIISKDISWLYVIKNLKNTLKQKEILQNELILLKNNLNLKDKQIDNLKLNLYKDEKSKIINHELSEALEDNVVFLKNNDMNDLYLKLVCEVSTLNEKIELNSTINKIRTFLNSEAFFELKNVKYPSNEVLLSNMVQISTFLKFNQINIKQNLQKSDLNFNVICFKNYNILSSYYTDKETFDNWPNEIQQLHLKYTIKIHQNIMNCLNNIELSDYKKDQLKVLSNIIKLLNKDIEIDINSLKLRNSTFWGGYNE